MYYNRSADELIFMKNADHIKLHRENGVGCKGKHWENGDMAEEHKNRISEAQKKRWQKIKIPNLFKKYN